MPTYKVSPRFIKNSVEFNRYRSIKDPTKCFEFEVGYRIGSFQVELSAAELKAIEKESDTSEFKPCDCDGFELLELFDSCWATLHFEESTIPEKEQKKIEDSFYEDGIEAFENCGYEFDEAYYVLIGALDFEKVSAAKKSKKEAAEDKDIFKTLGF